VTGLVVMLVAACGPSETATRDSDDTAVSAGESGAVSDPSCGTSAGPDGGLDLERIAPSTDDAARFAGCAVDSDCVAVPKVGCCHLGWKVAVNKDMTHAYGASYQCPIARPICIQILIIDNREPVCDPETQRCKLAQHSLPPRSSSCSGE
jgi:hypothetical protein